MVATVLSLYYEENQQAACARSLPEKYRCLAGTLAGPLTSPVLFRLVIQDIQSSPHAEFEPIINQYFAADKDSTYRRLADQQLSDVRSLAEGRPAPDFRLENLAGQPVTLADFRGKVIYLDFWFAGCGPCHQLFKAVKPAKDYFRADTNVVFLVVSIDERQIWKRAVETFQIGGYHAFTENKFREHPILNDYQVHGYPTGYLIDPKGNFFSLDPAKDAGGLIRQIQSAKDVRP